MLMARTVNASRALVFIVALVPWILRACANVRTGLSMGTALLLSTVHLGSAHYFGWLYISSANLWLSLFTVVLVGGFVGFRISSIIHLEVPKLPKMKWADQQEPLILFAFL
jgi:hypothetical protein